jgi:hypothetical protein
LPILSSDLKIIEREEEVVDADFLKLYIKTDPTDESLHPFAGYFLPYPDTTPPYEGLVSTITDEAPVMNWIYVDKETYEVKYGVRVMPPSSPSPPPPLPLHSKIPP